MSRKACCTTPSALCFPGCVFGLTYGVGLVALTLWAPLRPFDQTLVFAALGIACFVNAAANRTFHCMLTGPLFAVAAAVVAWEEAGVWDVNVSAVWSISAVGLGIALLLEWRMTARPARP